MLAATTTGKRARRVIPNPKGDPMSQAKCPNPMRSCRAAFCPSHQPVAYSEAAARHATDSIRISR